MSKTTNSVGQIGSFLAWCQENLHFLRMRWHGLKSKEADLQKLVAEIDRYGALYRQHTGQELKSARVFEVGYGARPLRLISLVSLGFDARGIDLDAPMLDRGWAALWRVLRTNGVLRFIKSAVRSLVFDAHERRALARVLAGRGAELRVEPSRFMVGDIANAQLSPGSVDFLFSEDVFEHIPRAVLPAVCASVARALAPNGLALLSPSVYTGICGGHLVEWYPHTFKQSKVRRSEPWEHLRQRRFVADCFLNELTVADYLSHFEQHLEVVAVHNLSPGLGREFLTDNIQAALANYSVDELLSEKWQFVMKKRSVTA